MTAADVQPRETCGDHWKRWKPWLIKHYLVLGFVFVIVLALSWPLPGRELGSQKSGDFPIAQTCCIVVIFFISGLKGREDPFDCASDTGKPYAGLSSFCKSSKLLFIFCRMMRLI